MDIRQQLLAAFEAEHREHLDAIRAALAAQATGVSADWNDVFRRAHSLKGAARAVDLPPVEALAHRLETLFEHVSTGKASLGRDMLAAVHLSLDRIESYVAELKGGAPVMPADAAAALDVWLSGRESKATPSDAAKEATASSQEGIEPTFEVGQSVLRVPAAAVQGVTDAAYGMANVLPVILPLSAGIARFGSISNDLQRRLLAVRRGFQNASETTRAGLSDIEAGLVTLTRLANELTRIERSATIALEGATARVREEAERLALVPAESAFGSFARALRDMAREIGLEVEVSVRGLEVPMDRGMLQNLKDPVLHALRNALSHGAEPEDERRRTGKPPNLNVSFEISVSAGSIVIAVHDDGRGPDLVGIERRARERGLIAASEPVDAARLLALVFEPGFSTAASVDTLAGRGIGLSVVAEAARKLQGSAHLVPRTPHGASLLIRVPLAASRRPVLLIEAGDSTYALASATTERVMHLEAAELGAVAGHPVVNLSGGERQVALPFLQLGNILRGVTAAPSLPQLAVLIRSGERRCVLGVEKLAEVRSLLILPPPSIGADPSLIAGTVIGPTGKAILLLDPDGLMDRAGDSASGSSRAVVEPDKHPAGTLAAARRSTILVVDDSITTRTLEKSILEAAGYRVVICVDGQDALDVLRAGAETIDLVVADVEMPRLDGFGLVGALRSQIEFAELPVILMTSRGSAEDVARGLELGANAYLTKQKFDQRELLETIGQLL